MISAQKLLILLRFNIKINFVFRRHSAWKISCDSYKINHNFLKQHKLIDLVMEKKDVEWVRNWNFEYHLDIFICKE